MKQFTASNGIIIAELQDPKRWTINPLNRSTQVDPFEMQALREFFRAEEDERLGRWRWPENPDYVVYPSKHSMREAQVVHEVTGCWGQWSEREAHTDAGRDKLAAAATAYFAAQPEPKPWREAKPGEVWALTVDGEESAFYPSKSLDRAFTPVAPETGRTAVSMESFEITAGRRIYPEPS